MTPVDYRTFIAPALHPALSRGSKFILKQLLVARKMTAAVICIGMRHQGSLLSWRACSRYDIVRRSRHR